MPSLAFYGSSLLSAYWNGAATYYRGLIRDLAGRGWRTTFCEPDAFERQQHRDIDLPDWAEVVVYPATEAAARGVIAEAARADVVVKASGVGVFDDLLLVELARTARPDAVRLFWDVDAPATLAEIGAAPDHPMRRVLPDLDLVLTYGGGRSATISAISGPTAPTARAPATTRASGGRDPVRRLRPGRPCHGAWRASSTPTRMRADDGWSRT